MLLIFCFAFTFLGFAAPARAYDYTGYLSYDGDHVWYSISLDSNDNLILFLDVPTGDDFDLYISTDGCMADGGYPENAIEYSEEYGDTDESINFLAPSTATFYVFVRSYEGSGSYLLTSNLVLTELSGAPACGPAIDPTVIVGIVIAVVVILAIVIGVVVKAKSGTRAKSYGSSYKGYSPSPDRYSTYSPSGAPSYSGTPSYTSYTPTTSKTSGMFSDLDSTPKTPSTSAPYSVSSAPVSGKKKVCPKCGVEWGPEAIFCGDCGHKFD